MNFLIFLFFPFFSRAALCHAPLAKVDNFKSVILGQIGQYPKKFPKTPFFTLGSKKYHWVRSKNSRANTMTAPYLLIAGQKHALVRLGPSQATTSEEKARFFRLLINIYLYYLISSGLSAQFLPLNLTS